jgi:PKD repeat protein
LTASVDGSSSADSDGTIASYAWAFGDGATATGVTASHPYAAAGTYTVSLTVTDDKGATNVKTGQVTVTAPPPPAGNVVARDLFERTTANGWGTADQGGAWAVTGTASRYSVAGGAGVITVPNSTSAQANLSSVSTVNAKVTATFSVDKIANGQYITVIGRQVGVDQYLLRARVAGDGTVQLYVLRNAVAVGAGYTVPGLVITPGAAYTVAFEVKGTAPTMLSAKVWPAGQAEPAAWQLTRTDATAALQAPGSIGINTFVPAAANAYPVKLSFSDITITDPTVP